MKKCKKIVVLFLSLAVFLTYLQLFVSADTVVTTGSGELAINGGFESLTGSAADNFTLYPATLLWDSFVITPTTPGYEPSPIGGNYIKISEKGNQLITFVKDLQPNVTYEFSVWVKSTVASSAQITYTAMHSDGNTNTMLSTWNTNNGITYHNKLQYHNILYFRKNYISTSGQWNKVKFNYTMPGEGNCIKVTLESGAADSNLCYDGLSVKKAENLISNGDFEGLKTTTDSAPERWRTSSDVTFLTESGYQDGNFVKIYKPDTTARFISQYVPVKKGGKYKLTFKAKSDFVGNPIFIKQEFPEDGTFISSDQKYFQTSATEEWKDYTWYICVGRTTISDFSEVILNFRAAIDGKNIYFDNIKLVEVQSGADFYSDGVKISQMPTSGNVDAKGLFVPVGTTGSEKAIGIICLYEKSADGEKLLSAYTQALTAIDGVAVDINKKISIPTSIQGKVHVIRVLFWGDLSTLTPVALKEELK